MLFAKIKEWKLSKYKKTAPLFFGEQVVQLKYELPMYGTKHISNQSTNNWEVIKPFSVDLSCQESGKPSLQPLGRHWEKINIGGIVWPPADMAFNNVTCPDKLT